MYCRVGLSPNPECPLQHCHNIASAGHVSGQERGINLVLNATNQI